MRRHVVKLVGGLAVGVFLFTGCRSGPERTRSSKPVVVTPDGAIAVPHGPTSRQKAAGEAPSTTYGWVPGYWTFQNMQWIWIPGYYQERPQVEAAWVPGRWSNTAQGWIWQPGHWEPVPPAGAPKPAS